MAAVLTMTVLLTALCAQASEPHQVLIPGDRIFPESMTSMSDGTLIMGSIGKGSVFRAKPGATAADLWIKPGTQGLLSVFGVLADEKSHILWVCSSEATKGTILAAPGHASAALMSFDLMNGAPIASFDFPGAQKSLCNDVAVAHDGTVYATDTRNARIFRLKKHAASLETWLQDDALQGGVDGIAFGDAATMYVTLIEKGKLLRIPVRADGSAGAVTEIKTSHPLEHPDGMRPVGPNQFLLAEGVGRADLVTVTGDIAAVELLKDGFVTPCGVTSVGNTAWVVEGKFAYRTDPKLQNQDAGPFYATAIVWRSAKSVR